MKTRVHDRLSRTLVQRMLESQKHASYVLITCGQPAEDGRMDVELTYDGDVNLAAYLVDTAQEIIEEKISQNE
jgi:hypothetical protein